MENVISTVFIPDPDNGLFSYGGFHANLAAGLEDSIIEA
jgi:hypothetical protein